MLLLTGGAAAAVAGQEKQEEKRLPDGRLQSEAILKEDHKRNLEDLRKMVDFIEEVEEDLKKHSGYVLSMENLKKLEEVEKLSRNIRGRMRRF